MRLIPIGLVHIMVCDVLVGRNLVLCGGIVGSVISVIFILILIFVVIVVVLLVLLLQVVVL